MTAEIAILNKSAVALAADSKVTIGGGQKTFDTVNKVFTLSKVHPVGIMLFGNAEFMEYPWETIIKLYRQQKRDHFELTVSKWASDFRQYLNGFGNIGENDKDANTAKVINSWFFDIIRIARSAARERNVLIPSEEFTSIIDDVLDQHIADASKTDELFDDDYAAQVELRYKDTINGLVKAYFRGYDSRELSNKARRLAKDNLRRKIASPISSGFVIAGFGEEEVFPHIVQYDTDGYIGDKLKIWRDRKKDISRDSYSGIYPFAQMEMVQRFMNGIDPDYYTFVHRATVDLLIKNCFAVLDKYGLMKFKTNAVRDDIVSALLTSIKEYQKERQSFQERVFSRPIVEMVALLPKDELPHLAESLVALTSLKRHVSHDVESVGGPIDVALITKGDGFIWIKRKHYFRAELNPMFGRNYLWGIETGDRHA